MSKRILLIIFSTFIFNGDRAYAYERADAFILRAHTNSYQILSPTKYQKKTNLIIENKTSVPLRGKVTFEDGRVLGHIAVAPGAPSTITLTAKKSEKIFFVPLSPPFQEFELKFGSKPYQIPAKKN